MCTVSFIPFNDKVFITSNRDEKCYRKQALSPSFYKHGQIEMLYPKDTDAGGTWIAIHENGNTAVLLNGAFKHHISKPPYKKSRGLILIEVLMAANPIKAFLDIDLIDVEQFTLILFDDKKLYECRWDGEQKFYLQLDEQEQHIWSSATLYDEFTVAKRKQWFNDWLGKQTSFSQSSILNFHQFTGDGDMANDFLMNRNNALFTVSITSIELTNRKGKMDYLDLQDKKFHTKNIEFKSFEVFA